MSDYDIVIVGAGHNALVCAGYLAKAGYSVCVLERRHKVGGAVVTEEIVPGFKFDLGGSAHILIHHTPIVADLELEQYGLDYIDLDPLFFAPFPDGSSITMHKSVDKTCDSIAAISQRDAEAYRKFIDTWTPVSTGTVDAFINPPTPLNMAKYLVVNRGANLKDPLNKINDIIRGYGPLLRNTFETDQVQSLIGWMAAQSGPPPSEPMSGPFALWHPMYHQSGMKRPRGGSGMLTQALANMIRAHGGDIHTNKPVSRILVENNAAVGVETVEGDRITARKVIAGSHIYTTVQLLGDDAPATMRDKVRKARIGNGFGMILRCAVSDLPDYIAAPSNGQAQPHHTAMQFICPSLKYLEHAYGDFVAGRPSQNPALIAMTWSAADPSLAPEGKHVLFLWAQYFPYELASGESWDDIGETVADNIVDTFAAYAPNVHDIMIDRLIEHPLYLERELGLHRGNVMHIEMSIDQMFALRPALGMSRYRTPVKNLYLTGASTHPGGGIMGAAGLNAAGAVLHDLSRRRVWRR